MATNLAACEYKAGRTLGKGSYGHVKEAIKISSGEHYAMKVISKSLMRGKESLVINEINILKKISQGHKNIVTLVDYFESPNNLYLVMDLCTGGELFDKICEQGIYYEEDAAEIVNTVLEVIKYLHSHNIVHRDIKPENLLFRNKEPNADLMVADFGLSRIVNDDEDYMLRTTCGTPSYMAPEIYMKTGHGKPVDIWAIGVMAYFLLSGCLPFDTGNQIQDQNAIIHGQFEFYGEVWSEVSENAKDFIKKCLLVDTSKRLTVQQALDHPWFKATKPKQDLFPSVRKGFDARRMFRKAIDVVKAVNKLSNSALNKSGDNGRSETDLRKDI